MGRTWRIRDRATFAALRRSRCRARAGALTLTWVPGPTSELPKVGYAIGRTVGPAVTRNRVRRRLRAAVHELAPRLAPGAYLVSASPQATRASFAELRSSLAAALAATTRVSFPGGGADMERSGASTLPPRRRSS